MNARQKAKKYKRLYEELLQRPMPKLHCSNHKIVTLCAEQVVEPDSMMSLDYANKQNAERLFAEVIKFIVVTSRKQYGLGYEVLRGEISVVDRRLENMGEPFF